MTFPFHSGNPLGLFPYEKSCHECFLVVRYQCTHAHWQCGEREEVKELGAVVLSCSVPKLRKKKQHHGERSSSSGLALEVPAAAAAAAPSRSASGWHLAGETTGRKPLYATRSSITEERQARKQRVSKIQFKICPWRIPKRRVQKARDVKLQYWNWNLDQKKLRSILRIHRRHPPHIFKRSGDGLAALRSLGEMLQMTSPAVTDRISKYPITFLPH